MTSGVHNGLNAIVFTYGQKWPPETLDRLPRLWLATTISSALSWTSGPPASSSPVENASLSIVATRKTCIGNCQDVLTFHAQRPADDPCTMKHLERDQLVMDSAGKVTRGQTAGFEERSIELVVPCYRRPPLHRHSKHLVIQPHSRLAFIVRSSLRGLYRATQLFWQCWKFCEWSTETIARQPQHLGFQQISSEHSAISDSALFVQLSV